MFTTFAVLFAVLGASGDVEAIIKSDPVVLSVGQKVKLANAIIGLFPQADTSKINSYYCMRHDYFDAEMQVYALVCSGVYTRTLSKSAYLAQQVAGLAQIPDSVVGANVTFSQAIAPKEADAAQRTQHAIFVIDAFSDLAIGDLLDFECHRDGGDIVCRANYVDQLSPDAYLALLQAGSITRPIRIVP